MEKKHLLLVLIVVALAASFPFIWFSIQKKDKKNHTMSTKIIVGTNAEYPPFSFIKNNTIVGFDIDVIKEVFKRLNKQVQIKDMSFKALIPSIQLGQVHIIAAGMTATPERAKHALFTKPYVVGDRLLIVNLENSPPILNIDALKNKKVIVDEGYTADMYISKQEIPNVIRLSSPARSFLALQSKRADAYIIAESSARLFFEKYGEKNFNYIPIEGTEETYSFAISKKHPDLLDKIQDTLDAIKKDGTLQELKAKWNIK